jgi:LPXTG-motif cell wall-anchored protein
VLSALNRQGFNGPIWALLSKNTNDYAQPPQSEVKYSDEYIITHILERQAFDGPNGTYGGWNLSGGSVTDTDIGTMTIQALAPYYNDDTVYNYTNVNSKQKCSKTVRQAVNEAFNKLSTMQNADGDFGSWGTAGNSEGTVQVVVSLVMCGIDPQTDPRFITSTGKTAIDGVLKYRRSDGGFAHTYNFDPANPDASGDRYNSMANDQASYALVAYWRFLNGMRNLYDFRPDFTTAERGALDTVMGTIDSALALKGQSGYKAALKQALTSFRASAFPQYIYNYDKLAAAIFDIGGEGHLDEEAIITGIEVAVPPAKTDYRELDAFDPSGMVVNLVYDSGMKVQTTEYTYEPEEALFSDMNIVTIRYFGLSTTLPITVSPPWDGEGTAASPYQIWTVSDLAKLSVNVSGNGKLYANTYFKLMNDLDFGDYGYWTPIGNDATRYFAGHFNGSGYSLYNFNVKAVSGTTGTGLFGFIGAGSSVSNLTIKSGSVSGSTYTAAFVGENRGGSLFNLVNYVNVNGVTSAGGIVGRIYGVSTANNPVVEIRGCVNYGNVDNGSLNMVGGIVGTIQYASSNTAPSYLVIMSGCYNNGRITHSSTNASGGIVGQISSSKALISGCANTGAVNNLYENPNNGNITAYTGGIAGSVSSSPVTIENCYNTGAVSGYAGIGGIAGYFASDNEIYNCYNTGVVTPDARGTNPRAGAIAGIAGAPDQEKITGNYYLNSLSVPAIGSASEAGFATAKLSGDMKKAAFVTELNSYTAKDTETVAWTLVSGKNDGYPMHTSQILRTVTFKVPGYSDVIRTVPDGGTLTAIPAIPAKTGYDQTAPVWDTADFTNIMSDMTVNAVYTINTYTVTFVDGIGNTVSTVPVHHGGAAQAPTAMRAGWVFDGWDNAFDNVTTDLTVTARWKAPLTGISIGENFTLNKNTQKTLTVTYIPDYTTDDKTVQWESKNTGVATVNGSGTVTAVGTGTAKIIAKVGGKTAECTVTVIIPLNAGEKTLMAGDITMEAAPNTIPDDALMQAVKVASPSTLITEAYKKYSVYDIYLVSDGGTAQPSGNVTVFIPIPEDFDRTQLQVAHIKGDGTLETLIFTIDGNEAKFEAGHLGIFAIASGIGNNDILPDENGSDITVTDKDGVLADGTKLVVTPITDGDDLDKANIALDGKADKFLLFDISLFDKDGMIIDELTGHVTVSIPVPKGYDASLCKIYRVEADGSLTDMKATVIDGMLVFETDHFSIYAIAQISTADSTPGNPKTGDSSNPLVPLAMMIISMAALAVLSKKRRKAIK